MMVHSVFICSIIGSGLRWLRTRARAWSRLISISFNLLRLFIRKHWIKAAKLCACLRNAKTPIHCGFLHIADILPSCTLALQPIAIRDTLLEALVDQNRQLNLDHVEPRAMFGGIVKFELIENTPSLGWFKRFI